MRTYPTNFLLTLALVAGLSLSSGCRAEHPWARASYQPPESDQSFNSIYAPVPRILPSETSSTVNLDQPTEIATSSSEINRRP